jgi:crotonobetainyl-CoA:carnitine CoA-transferase CaiB-like acyl-CoA transferase
MTSVDAIKLLSPRTRVRRWHRVIVILTALCVAAVFFGTAMTVAKAGELPPLDGSDSLACRAARGELPGQAPVNPRFVSPQVFSKLNQKEEIRRQRMQAACDEIKREQAAERKEWNKAQAAEAERRKVEAELNRKRQEQAAAEAKEQARVANLPINRVFRGYQFYAHVKFCNDVREGYLVQYVNDAEMMRAEKAIKSIVEQATKDDTTINTDDVWKQALEAVQGKPASISFCQQSLAQLLNLSPTTVYSIAKP